MQWTDDSSAPIASYLLEHSHGTCELWIKRSDTADLKVFEPLKLQRVSGIGKVLLRREMIAEAIRLEEWMAEHFEVFEDGRTSHE